MGYVIKIEFATYNFKSFTMNLIIYFMLKNSLSHIHFQDSLFMYLNNNKK